MENEQCALSATDELTRLRLEIGLCRRELKASRDELAEFTYGAAHDLLGSLIRASSSCQVLLEDYPDQLDHGARRWVDLALHHVELAQRRIAALRRLTEVHTEAQPFEPIDTNVAFQEVLGRLSIQIAHTAATVSCGPLGWIRADLSQITLLLENLIGNGLKFAGNQVPIIEVGLMPHATTQHSQLSEAMDVDPAVHRLAQYFVRDNGVGILAESLKSIFLPFHQLQPQTERIGDGIGLALCHRIVKRHGGTMWAESTVGDGSVFYFTVPTL